MAGELVLGAAAADGVQLITRVVDYGGLFHDDVPAGHEFAAAITARFAPPAGSRPGMSGSSACGRSPSATG